MKRFFLIIALLIVSSLSLHAQNSTLLDVVYLKNGSIIRGIITEQIPNDKLKIATRDGSLFVYKMDEVERIIKEENTSKTKLFSEQTMRFPAYEPGYQGSMEISYGIGVGDLGSSRAIFQTVHGYRFNPYLFVGAGVGVDYNTDIESVFIPVFANIKGYFTKTMVRPYVSLDLGYAVATESLENPLAYSRSDEKIYMGGFLINPMFGVDIRVSDRHSITFAVGYRMQSVPTYATYYYGTGLDVERQMSGAVNFKLGFTF